MRMIFLVLSLVLGIITVASLETASGQTAPTVQGPPQKMFNPASTASNTYNDPIHNFSISPPDGWTVESQSNGNGSALVTFSNKNPQSLANFGIYYNQANPIPQSVISLSDDKILSESISKLFDPLQFTVLQKNIQRFADGFVIEAVLEPIQNTQNSPKSEWVLFWLDDGRQYFLILTSSQNNFDQNQADFERSVVTFNVEDKATTVPEFGPVAIITFTAMISITLILLKTRDLNLTKSY